MNNNPVAYNDALGLSTQGNDQVNQDASSVIGRAYGIESDNPGIDISKSATGDDDKKKGKSGRSTVCSGGIFGSDGAVCSHGHHNPHSIKSRDGHFGQKVRNAANNLLGAVRRLKMLLGPIRRSAADMLKELPKDPRKDSQGYYDLYKSDLRIILKRYFTNVSENLMGRVFENFVYQGLKWRDIGFNWRKNTTKERSSGRASIPDFIGDQPVSDAGARSSRFIRNAAWVEAKAKEGNLYRSSNLQQILRHIDNLSGNFAGYNTGISTFRPSLYIITTADVKVSPEIMYHATKKGVHLVHYHLKFKPLGRGRYEFEFKQIGTN